MKTIELTITYDELIINHDRVINASRQLPGVYSVNARMRIEYPDNKHWEKCTSEQILEALHLGPKYGGREMTIEDGAEIKDAQLRKAMIPVIKVVRKITNTDLKWARDWTESFLNCP